MFEKFKLFVIDDAIFMTILLVMVGLASFLLGQLSVTSIKTTAISRVSLSANSVNFSGQKTPIISTPMGVEKNTRSSQVTNVITNTQSDQSFQYVASKSGTKYHLVTCPGAKQIKKENKIYFNSAEEAEAAGYTSASNCPGL